MRFHLAQCRKIDLQQHGDDHYPDQQANRQVDLRVFHAADGLEHVRHDLPQRNADDDAQRDPDGEVALEEPDGRLAGCLIRRGDVLAGHRSAPRQTLERLLQFRVGHVFDRQQQ
ncbi:hypothetical protein D3C81_1547610 [compost metagenome]